MYPGAKYDGVFSMWYGKGPGVDRCGDVFKHANYAGTSKHGGVLVLAGDDHAAKSSTLPHQSDHQFAAAMMPVLYPSSVQEIIDLGLHGWAMSRYSGLLGRLQVRVRHRRELGLGHHRPRSGQDRDARRLPVSAGRRAHPLARRFPRDRSADAGFQDLRRAALLPGQPAQPHRHRLARSRASGIITSGKSYLDVRQALDDLGISEADAAEIGIRVFKVAMPWPLEPEGVRHFAEGLDEILVVEEKRQIVEYQLKEQLYNWRTDVRPRVVGKFDEKGEWMRPHGDWLLPAASELTPAMIARVIAQRIARLELHPRHKEKIESRVAFINAKEAALAKPKISLQRIPYFCSGCPHNTSTKVPEGSRSTAGIGCHVMAIWMDRSTSTFTHMGGEGVPWIGRRRSPKRSTSSPTWATAPITTPGVLAIRAVGRGQGQHHLQDPVQRRGRDDRRPAGRRPDLAGDHRAAGRRRRRRKDRRRQRRAGQVSVRLFRGRHRDPPSRRPGQGAARAPRHAGLHRAALRPDLRGGKAPPPQARQVSRIRRSASSSTSWSAKAAATAASSPTAFRWLPVETEFGRKRTIDQSSCNKDFSCVNGFCPSFVTVEGGGLRKPKRADALDVTALPDPAVPATTEPYGILVTGIGGTGVVTIGALLGMAAHLAGKGCSVLDMTGLAQKNGAVVSHVRIADTPERIHATRIAAGEAKLVLACDILTGVGDEAIAKMQRGVTKALVNTALVMPAEFTRNADLKFPLGSMEHEIRDAVAPGDAEFLDATRLATGLMGDSIATNLFMVGFAYQRGLIPLAEDAILRAIELNGAAVESNKQSFRWGRLAAVDPARVAAAAVPASTSPSRSACRNRSTR